MGTSRSAAEFSGRIRKLALVTQARRKDTVTRGALATKTIILNEAATKGVTPSSKIAGGKWGVGFDVKGFNNPSALVRIRGAFHLVDRPTQAHQIGPRRRGRRSTGKQAIAFNGVVRAHAQHPGTKGKRIFAGAKAEALVAVPRVMAQSVISGWRDALR